MIGLFPDLLPDEIRRNIPYPSALPNDFSEKDFDDGIRAVQNYLSEIRTNLAQQLDRQNRLRVREKTDAEFLSEAQLNEIRNLLQIVDTTLLKCYLRVFYHISTYRDSYDLAIISQIFLSFIRISIFTG